MLQGGEEQVDEESQRAELYETPQATAAAPRDGSSLVRRLVRVPGAHVTPSGGAGAVATGHRFRRAGSAMAILGTSFGLGLALALPVRA